MMMMVIMIMVTHSLTSVYEYDCAHDDGNTFNIHGIHAYDCDDDSNAFTYYGIHAMMTVTHVLYCDDDSNASVTMVQSKQHSLNTEILEASPS